MHALLSDALHLRDGDRAMESRVFVAMLILFVRNLRVSECWVAVSNRKGKKGGGRFHSVEWVK